MPSFWRRPSERPVAEDTPSGDSVEARAYRRGFRQKSRRDDYALDLFEKARTVLATDPERLGAILGELARLYNPVVNEPIVDLDSRTEIMRLVAAGRVKDAEERLDRRYHLYAPLDDAERQAPGGGAG